MKYVLAVIAVLIAVGCKPDGDGCTAGDARCAGADKGTIQFCNSAGEWEDSMDCTEYGLICDADLGVCVLGADDGGDV